MSVTTTPERMMRTERLSGNARLSELAAMKVRRARIDKTV